MTKGRFVVIIFPMLKRAFKGLIDIIYPEICLLCGRRLTYANIDGLICLDCWEGIERNSSCHACLRYEGRARRLIHLFKYTGRIKLKTVLSRLLIEHINSNFPLIRKTDFIVPIPLHKRKLRERDYNPAALLAREIAKEFAIEMFQGLHRVKYTRPQSELRPEKKADNVKRCFALSNPDTVKDKSLMLFDDITTTRSTINEASKILRQAGCAKIYVYTLAN